MGDVSFCVQNFGEFRKRRNEVRAKEKQNLDKREILGKIFVIKFADGVLRIMFPISDF